MRQAELKCKVDNRINRGTEDGKDRSKQKVENRKNGKTPVCADLSLLHVEVGACDAFWV